MSQRWLNWWSAPRGGPARPRRLHREAAHHQTDDQPPEAARIAPGNPVGRVNPGGEELLHGGPGRRVDRLLPRGVGQDPVGPGDALGEQVGVSRPVHPRRGEEAPRGDVRLRLDLGNVANTMRGGIGASWHAIEKPLPYSEQPDPVFQLKSHGGSGWGAYPPAGDQAARDQIDRHARWLGLDFNR